MDFGRCRIIEHWVGWEYSVHADEAQISRQGRAMTYPFEFMINNNHELACFSSTSDKPFYFTTLSECNCHDFQERRLPCKHIYRLAVELGVIEIISRPSFDKEKLAEVRDSDDIDNHPEQVKRQKSGMDKSCMPAEIDFDNKTGVFWGSGKKPYEAAVDSCTCRDYFVRRLPCKHIYRLRYEINKAIEG